MWSTCVYFSQSHAPSWFNAEAQMLFHCTSYVVSSWLVQFYNVCLCVHSVTQNTVDRIDGGEKNFSVRHALVNSLLYAIGLRYLNKFCLCKWTLLCCGMSLSNLFFVSSSLTHCRMVDKGFDTREDRHAYFYYFVQSVCEVSRHPASYPMEIEDSFREKPSPNIKYTNSFRFNPGVQKELKCVYPANMT